MLGTSLHYMYMYMYSYQLTRLGPCPIRMEGQVLVYVYTCTSDLTANLKNHAESHVK